ncbi:MAG: DNA-directed RNA polymerase subunit D [Candidatus Nanohaloarchaea archaeon]|nr:DNA-directed RNA polymerase subunit D [Candidatus Nanohaloarchaea archaeon]
MEVNILEEEDDRLKFVLEGVDPEFANAVRRTAIAKVPTMAVKEVDFINNTSGLFDEILAHRIGMVPWKFDREHYNIPEDCDCEDDGCHNCQVTLALKKEGEGDVRASDFKPTDKDVETTNPDILLAKLLEDQEVELEAKAVLGIGKDHAKFQAANASYRYYPIVRVNGKEVENREEAVKLAPEEVKNADGAIEADNDIVYAMEDAVDIEEGDEIEIEQRDDKFIFEIESVSGLEPREILVRAVDIVSDEVDEFESIAKQSLE